MSACEALIANAAVGAAPALRAVDCMANDFAASGFARAFGSNGALLPALTILLTLYVAFFAFALITGRSRLGVGALMPRMLLVGAVLTFATSWIAWQQVVWNLVIGAPDQLAGVLMGVKGSSTQMLAGRIDLVVRAIAEVDEASRGAAGQAAAGATAGVSAGAFAPPGLMWLGAMLLLLGTIGVLVTTRIALGLLLALGPVFVVLALFGGTRGLFVGWLRALVLMAVVPLFVVAGGMMMLELLAPVLRGLAGPDGIEPQAAIALFLIAAVYVALMVMAVMMAGRIVSAWTVFGLGRSGGLRDDAPGQAWLVEQAAGVPIMPVAARTAVQGIAGMTGAAGLAGLAGAGALVNVTELSSAAGDAPQAYARAGRRPLGVGSRYANRAAGRGQWELKR